MPPGKSRYEYTITEEEEPNAESGLFPTNKKSVTSFYTWEGPTGSCSVSTPICPLILLHLEGNRCWTRKGLTFWRERSIKNWTNELSFRWTCFHSPEGVTAVEGTPQTPMPSLGKEWDARVRAHPTCPCPTQAPVLLRGCCCRGKCVQSGIYRRSSRS